MPDAIVEREGHVLVVTLNRPERMNAPSGAMLVRMYDAFVEASTKDDVRCIILTGAGGNTDPGIDVTARMSARLQGEAQTEPPTPLRTAAYRSTRSDRSLTLI
ncbi:MAG TPA: enoyl-CoA hydratase-related protein [Candidatus Binatia bacterium]